MARNEEPNESNAYGFTFVDEEEFNAYEAELRKQTETQARVATKYQDKLTRVLNLIDPFLKNLASEPNKIYIKWANRADKVKQFQEKINAIIKE